MEMPIDVGHNQAMKDCLSHYEYHIDNFDTFNWSRAAACFHSHKERLIIAENQSTRDFLKDNPLWRIPGGSSENTSPCWGKAKLYHRERGC